MNEDNEEQVFGNRLGLVGFVLRFGYAGGVCVDHFLEPNKVSRVTLRKDTSWLYESLRQANCCGERLKVSRELATAQDGR